MTPYSKLNSQGNDFILVEKHMVEVELTADAIKKYSSRENIGCDQFFIIDTNDKKNIRCEVYNQDGSIACQCGNGLRAAMLYLNKKYNLESTNIIICDTAYYTRIIDNTISVDMGKPTYIKCPNIKDLQVIKDGLITSVESKVHNLKFSFMSMSIGNEHSVVFSKDCLEGKDLISKIIENIFGYEMNIGFIDNADEFLNNNNVLVNLTVKERGAGYTSSCGSGATAAAICLFKLSESKYKDNINYSKIKIKQKGGLLEVKKNHSDSFELIGPSSYDGEGYLAK
tara:strand:- start:316 stop:1164 length:849 start_codon:yes stop_codon:yes gene_type:complete